MQFLFNFLKDRAVIVAYLCAGLITYSLAATAYKQNQDATLARSIVKVLNRDERGGGTGWVTYAKGKKVIITNDHVCEVGSGGFVLVEKDDGRKYLRRILKRNYTFDLCMVEGVQAPVLKLSDEDPERFDDVYVTGHPSLKPTTPSTGKFTGNEIVPIGGLSETGECRDGDEKIQLPFFGTICIHTMELGITSVTIFPGSSGSPVLNSNSEVIGVMNSSGPDNYGAFIPLERVKEFINE